MTPALVLTVKQIQAFHRDGFLHLSGLYDAEETGRISAWTDELSSSPETVGRDWKYFETDADGNRILCRIENFIPYHDGLARLITQRRMAQAVAELFSEPAVLFKDKINYKLPGGDGFKAHQDMQAGWTEYAPVHITAMIAIDETNALNGSLEIAAGLHRDGPLGRMWEPLSDADIPGAVYEPVHCVPGDAVFFDSFAPHRSAPNRTDLPRRVLYITFNAASAGDHRARYYADKHRNFPPDIERDASRSYGYKV